MLVVSEQASVRANLDETTLTPDHSWHLFPDWFNQGIHFASTCHGGDAEGRTFFERSLSVLESILRFY